MPVCINSFENCIVLCDKEQAHGIGYRDQAKTSKTQADTVVGLSILQPQITSSICSCVKEESTAQIRKVFMSDGHEVYEFDIESDTYTTLMKNRENCGTMEFSHR